jgi:hypothetical protein
VTNGGVSAYFLVSLVYVHSLLCSVQGLTGSQHADNAQHAFSSSKVPTLHFAIPALEGLHRAWSTRAEGQKYERFAPALHAACEKVNEYYEKTTDTPAYIMAMSE